MQKLAVAACAAVFLGLTGVATAAPGDKLDPSDMPAGYAPPSQGGLSCTRYMNKRVTIMPLNCELKCATSFASAASRGLAFDYDYCRSTWTYSCESQYQRALEKLDQGTCMNCLDATARQGLYPLYRDVVNVAKDQIYCDNNPANTPFPDGHGFVSQQRDVVKCQNKITRSLEKAAKCLNLHCHQKTTELMFWDKPIRTTFAECESTDVVKSCKARFQQSVLKAGSSCPPCLDANAIWTSFHTALEANNGEIYCSDAP
ncbi:MAG: hypothetical protein IT294_08795 [Deltaproteobacteria bacterium]|nr:hypothetical protein [Deltaproteobacteria bacterium]